VVQSQPWQIVHKTLSQNNPMTKKGLVEWGVVQGVDHEFKSQSPPKKSIMHNL
jgi:hypothetical protein